MHFSTRRPLSRWSAALIHALVSILVVALGFGLLFWLWYHPGLWSVAGFSRQHWLLLGASVLAPALMTLATYRNGKRGMRGDLLVIALIQLALLGYTVFAFARLRPVYLVAAVDRFELVRAGELSPEGLATAPSEYRRLSWTGPRVVGIRLPEDENERFKLILSGLAGKDVKVMPRLYVPYENTAKEIAKRAKPLAELLQRQPGYAKRLPKALTPRATPTHTAAYVPITGPNDTAAVMLLEHPTGRVIGAVKGDPWPVEPGTNSAQ